MESKAKVALWSIGTFFGSLVTIFGVAEGLQTFGVSISAVTTPIGLAAVAVGSLLVAVCVAFIRVYEDLRRSLIEKEAEISELGDKAAVGTGTSLSIPPGDLHSKPVSFQGQRYNQAAILVLQIIQTAGSVIKGEQYLRDLVFLVERAMNIEPYNFVPGRLGPNSAKLARDLEQLESEGFLIRRAQKTEYGTEVAHELTAKGMKFLDKSRSALPRELTSKVREILSKYPNFAAADRGAREVSIESFAPLLTLPNVDRIALGTRNQAKVEAVRNVVDLLWGAHGMKIPLTVPVQIPAAKTSTSESDAMKMAIERARRALEGDSKAGLGIGLEGYVADVQTPKEIEMFLGGWVAIVERRSGRVSLGCSARVKIPDRVARRVRAGEELEDAVASEYSLDMREHELRQSGGTNALLTNSYYTRVKEFEDATICALAPLMSEKYYVERN